MSGQTHTHAAYHLLHAAFYINFPHEQAWEEGSFFGSRRDHDLDYYYDDGNEDACGDGRLP